MVYTILDTDHKVLLLKLASTVTRIHDYSKLCVDYNVWKRILKTPWFYIVGCIWYFQAESLTLATVWIFSFFRPSQFCLLLTGLFWLLDLLLLDLMMNKLAAIYFFMVLTARTEAPFPWGYMRTGVVLILWRICILNLFIEILHAFAFYCHCNWQQLAVYYYS